MNDIPADQDLTVLEAIALVAIVGGGYLLFGPWALVVGGLLVLGLSWLVNRPRKERDGE